MARIPQKQIDQLYTLACRQRGEPVKIGNWKMLRHWNNVENTICLYHYDVLVSVFDLTNRNLVVTKGAYSVSDRDGINSLINILDWESLFRVSIINGRICLIVYPN